MFKLTRQGSEPILKPDSKLDWEKEGVFNPGVIKYKDEVYLLYRAIGERKAYISSFGLAKSHDGIKFERVSQEPILKSQEIFDHWGMEDPRITKIGDDFYITYVAVPKRIMEDGKPAKHFMPLETACALLKTKDFLSYKNLGIISPAKSDNKDIVLFPRQINQQYFMLHRPNNWSQEWFNSPYEKYLHENLPCAKEDLPLSPSIWISSSTDLKNWVNHRLLMTPLHSSDIKIGPGLPPIETEAGWLIIYHHVKKEELSGKFIYSVRAALLALDDPTKLIAKLNYDILTPETDYETEAGAHIIFPTGGLVDNDKLYIYYGASDRYIGLATGSLSELLTELKQNPYETAT